ncbi:hypothetical protein D9619_003772 [Psilocybe cf. subviscida]|uniref:Uncharacterized protein n=1 Tax=Psilocybe cf. subviscida TaxID=2480587 RepID=A0A8H5AVS1_9AGAR|nr:hypothetical protein D9619_003772 [Psilocybe cf. subviscida]
MQDYPSIGLKPTHRTGRTVTLFKSSAAKGNAIFSPITIFPMALSARSYVTTTSAPTILQDQSHRSQPIASGSKDPLPLTVHDDGHPASITRNLSSTSNVDGITNGRYQHPTILSTPKVPFLNRKLDRSRSHRPTPGTHEGMRTGSVISSSSPYQMGTTGARASKSWTKTLRARAVSSKSGSAYSQEELPAESSLPGPSTQGTRARSDDSLESGVNNQRVVGRGGSGSRPRVVVAEDQMPTFDIPTRKGSLSLEQQPVLRPSGRGGFASRPQPLAPPPPPVLPKSPLSSDFNNIEPPALKDFVPHQLPAEPVFVRPGGRGGAGSRAKINAKSNGKPPLGANSSTPKSTSLLARLQKRKIKSQLQREQQQQKGKSPEVNYGVHPVRESMAYRIVNGSSTTLSTIQFNSDPQPRLPLFPDEESVHNDSIRSHITLTSLGPEDMSWTPTNTFSSSNSDCISSTSMNETPDDESQLDAYYIEGDEELQETRPTTPTYHHQRTLDKLTRTLGETPTIHRGPQPESRPQLAVKTTIATSPSRNVKIRGPRRASISLSVSSIFMRPRRGSTTSESTVASASDDLHLSNRSSQPDSLSASRDLARDSYSSAPGSPMIFSTPSPTSLQGRRQSLLTSPRMQGLEEDMYEGTEGDAGDEESVKLTEEIPNSDSCEASPVLSRSQSVTLNSASRRQSTWRASHAQSASMSVLDAGSTSMLDEPPGPLAPKSHPNWLFPPEDDSDDPDRPTTAFSAILRRQRHETTIMVANHEQGWTGEWNSDLQDVIRSLRSLH